MGTVIQILYREFMRFLLTNFWGHIFAGNDPHKAEELEKQEALNLAKAASTIPTLEDYIWSTLHTAGGYSNSKFPIPHFDYKAEIDDKIRSQFPELAKKPHSSRSFHILAISRTSRHLSHSKS
jgi:hypothetical protein